MNNIKRRHFLQFAGSTLAALGLSQLDVMQQSSRYARVLAQDTSRKLALLVGINDYPFKNTLYGCRTDVELQQQLLIHRFGFKEEDIRTLKDKEATRQGIYTAFEEHLINQAQPGHVVVFHFSGHGSQVYDADCDFKEHCLNSTFIPFDNNLSFAQRNSGGEVNDIMGHTLFLLMYALKTENVTVVLDSCHSGGGTRGNLIVRSGPGGKQLKPSQAEINYQQKWLERLNLKPEEFRSLRKAGVAKGVVIAAAKREQFAADAQFANFHAGAFTYAMTQYLWQEPGNEQLEVAWNNIVRTAQSYRTSQEPEYEKKPGSHYEQQPIYFLNKSTPSADAAITSINGDSVTLWMGGINPKNLSAFDSGGIFTILDAGGQDIGQVKLEPQSLNLLSARGKLLQSNTAKTVQPGALLQEQVRAIPRNISLRIGLDPSLGKDTTKAEIALKAIKRIQVFPVQHGEEVAYIFGKITQENLNFQKSDLEQPPVGSIGLFTPAMELIPKSFGEADEMVEQAVNRLKSKFKSLLAAHIAKIILNADSSRLKVTVSLCQTDSRCDISATVFPVRGNFTKKTDSQFQPSSVSTLKLPLGTSLLFQVSNGEDRDLYVSVLVIDPEGEMTVIFPNNWNKLEDITIIEAGEKRNIPEKGTDKFQFIVAKPLGTVEILVIASTKPLKQTLLALRNIATRGGTNQGPQDVRGDDATDVTEGIIEDFQPSNDNTDSNLENGVSVADTRHLAALSITFQSVENS